VATLLGGNFEFHGDAQSEKTTKKWPFDIAIYQLDEKSQNFEGTITWPTLNSVHAIKGSFVNGTLQFKETEHVIKGGAHLFVSYQATPESVEKGWHMSGTWKDPKGDYGIFHFEVTDKQGNQFNLREQLFTNQVIKGTAKSSKSGKNWPFNIKMDGKFATELQDFQGEIQWPTLGSTHLIRGLLSHGRLTFKEHEYIKKGKAHLNVSYTLWYENGIMTGTYKDPKGDYGTIYFPVNK
jgi:hypothetical protein